VTNAQFREFVTTTGYVTLAERGVEPATHPGMPKELLVPGSVVHPAHQCRERRA
jgi:sulfatase modifying factor 1